MQAGVFKKDAKQTFSTVPQKKKKTRLTTLCHKKKKRKKHDSSLKVLPVMQMSPKKNCRKHQSLNSDPFGHL